MFSSDYLRFAAQPPICLGEKPVCTTCLYSANEQSCAIEGYEEDCSAMTEVRG